MRLMFIGDVVSKQGCEFLAKNIFDLKKEYGADILAVNGENSAPGNGITKSSLEMLTNCGADVITTGNHSFKRRESVHLYDECEYLLRPINYPDGVIGKGMYVLDLGRTQVAFINAMGVIYLEPIDNPFTAIDNALSKISTPNIFIDFHAEATSEKKCIGHYFTGRVTGVFGTHTHVQTADEMILGDHTAYITDVGMTGPERSVLGVDSDIATDKMRLHFPVMFEESKEPCFINGVVVDFDEQTGKARDIKRIIKR